MKNKDIIVITQQGWDEEIRTNPRMIVSEFVKHNRVLYINPPLDINTVVKGFKNPRIQNRINVLLGRKERLVQMEENLWVYTPAFIGLSINWISSQKIYKILNKINSTLFANSIKSAAKNVGFDNFILFEDALIFNAVGLDKKMNPELYLYYIRDYVIGLDYFKVHGPWAEAALMKQADLVVANSIYLANYAKNYNSNSYDVGQGCELGSYTLDQTFEKPTDLASIKQPIIGYTGYLTAWRLDIPLLVHIATSKPEWNLVLVGPEDEKFMESALHDLPNVFFLGGKEPSELPVYVNFFDVCINPQVLNEMTVGNYPLKIDEYLAMGKPVVATKTGAMEMFEDYVYLASSPNEWVIELEKAVAEDSKSVATKRISFANSHTWEACVQAMYKAIENVQR
jgi:teichuronic acid biosynthesis glycosyltransferase TuaH